MYFRNEFERDLIAAYNRVLKTCGRQAMFMTRQEIITKTITDGAPKFYITYEMARRNVSALLRGVRTDCNNRLKQLMYADIARLTIDYQRRHKRYANDFNGALMCVLSEMPAPRFYITEKSAYNTLCRLLRRKDSEHNNETIKSNNNENKQL